jgi:peptide/nickel transport system ATP-binding protein
MKGDKYMQSFKHEDDDNILLNVKDLKTFFYTDSGEIKAVNGVSFQVNKREVVGLVGESGCGKSVTARSILRLINSPPGKIVSGEIMFKGKQLLKLSENKMRKIRGKDISMIFQEPMTALNPVYTIGYQIEEVILNHSNMNRVQAHEEALKILRLVEIPDPERRISWYPHQLSGGMRQRVIIAIALACRPKLIIADEPTTALDVTVQAQIQENLCPLRQRNYC